MFVILISRLGVTFSNVSMFSYSKIGSFLLRGDDDDEGDGEPVGDGGGDGENRES